MTKRPRSSKSQESGHQPPYICVECGAPCESLYHQLSPSSIKALTCSNCGEIADPYIEQEWLLVVIDCILMRLEAYRHVLFNTDEMKRPSRNQLVISGLIWSILDAYLKFETQRLKKDSTELYSTVFVGFLVTSSSIGLLLEFLVLQLYLKDRLSVVNNISQKIFLALLLPNSFVMITMLVIIWENTQTVRLLGSLLTVCWQTLAISVVSRDFTAPILWLVVRILCKMAQQSIPCLGLEVVLDPWALTICLP